VLLAALGNRRPTQDADLLARGISNSHDIVIGYINEIACIDLHGGMTFDPTTTVAITRMVMLVNLLGVVDVNTLRFAG